MSTYHGLRLGYYCPYHTEPEGTTLADGTRMAGTIAWPQLATHRTPLAVEHRGHDHLLQVGSMVLAVAIVTQGLAPFPLEVDRRGVEEHQVQAGEQVTAKSEQPFLDQVLGASRGKRRRGELLVLWQGFNIASNPKGRPRFLIDPKDVEAFEARRSIHKTPSVPRRRKRTSDDVIEFF